MKPWLAVLEAMMVKKLLESHTFHQGVRKAHKSWYRLRNGPLEGDDGGTNLERQGPGFGSHFWDEIQTQIGRKKVEDNPLQKSDPTHTTQSHQSTSSQQDQDRTTCPNANANSEPQPAKESFLSHFMDELRSQSRGRDKNS